jgi:hypothetical protein
MRVAQLVRRESVPHTGPDGEPAKLDAHTGA